MLHLPNTLWNSHFLYFGCQAGPGLLPSTASIRSGCSQDCGAFSWSIDDVGGPSSPEQCHLCTIGVQPRCHLEGLHPAPYGNRCRDSQLNVRQSLGNPSEEWKEGLQKPEESRSPLEHGPQNQLSKTDRGSQKPRWQSQIMYVSNEIGPMNLMTMQFGVLM